MFIWVLNTNLAGTGRKSYSLKKNLLTLLWKCQGKNFVIVFRGIFRTQLNIYDGAFFGKIANS